jgi:hypothetical protein
VVDNMGFISTVTHPVVVGAGSSPPTTPAPTVTTGSAGSVGSSSATLTGTVNPRGAATTYHFEFGTTTAYGHSSVAASSGGGTSAVAVAAGLGGLAPRTLYHYRLVASSAGGTTVGADRTFVTGAAPPPPPRFSFRLTSGHALGAALRHGLRLRFSCSSACTARFNVTLVLPGVTRLAATPVTVAQGQRRLGSAGSGRLTLLFSSAARTRLRRRGTVRLTIAGYAVRPGGATSEPKTVRLTLRR